jgi:hypothetical protein
MGERVPPLGEEEQEFVFHRLEMIRVSRTDGTLPVGTGQSDDFLLHPERLDTSAEFGELLECQASQRAEETGFLEETSEGEDGRTGKECFPRRMY